MRICKIEGCDNKHFAKGYCNKHYNRRRTYGDPMFVKQIQERHGLWGTPEYRVWAMMKDRCYNINNKSYHRYGGRGITVCGRWKNSFLAFLEDMGYKPFPKAQIDRKNNDGNYIADNCWWVTRKENMRNGSLIKLTMQKANEIRIRYKTKNITQKTLGLIYRIDPSEISLIVNNKLWV